MSKWVHLTEKKNIDSIYQYGIIPSYIKMDQHWKSFKRDGLKQRKCIYTWNAETYNNARYIKDMIYTKLFIHPRNDMIDLAEKKAKGLYGQEYEDAFPNMLDFDSKLFGTNNAYILMEVNDYKSIGQYTHAQEPSSYDFCSTRCMDDKYAHDDKKIMIVSDTIKNFKLVEEIQTRVYKNNTIGFTFLKYRG